MPGSTLHCVASARLSNGVPVLLVRTYGCVASTHFCLLLVCTLVAVADAIAGLAKGEFVPQPLVLPVCV